MIICRLCFKIQGDPKHFKAIEEDMKNVLEKVLQNMDFITIQNPVMCTNCADTLMKCFDFKAKCMSTHNYIAPFINKQNNCKLDLLRVYMTKNENSSGILDDQKICGLCMSTSLSVAIEVDIALTKMIRRCIPELDMNIIEKPVICVPCRGSLENCFHFVTNCLIAEEKFKKYCESQDVDSNGGMDLSRLWQFAIRDGAGSVGGSLTDLIKVEDQFCEETENADKTGFNNGGGVLKFEQVFCDDYKNTKEEFELKSEHFMDTDELKFKTEEDLTSKDMACKYVVKIEEPFCGENGRKEENPFEMEDQNFLPNKEVAIKACESDFNRFEDGILPEPKVGTNDLEKHSPIHKDLSEVIMYKCDTCSYQAKRKTHIRRHLLQHKDPSEVTMYKCNSCLYQTKNNENLQRHLLKHKDPSEVTTHKCDSCSYQTIDKSHFNRHLLKHRDPSEVTMYKCNSCLFETKYKSNIDTHLLKHKDPSQVTMYKCDSCAYQSKEKRCLQKHLLKHKDPSEVTMYKCNSCLYETKYKANLDSHMLKHKDPSQVTTYKCDLCSYQSKDKKGFRKHSLIHKDPSEVTMYKCNSCSFETKHKISINRHLLAHVDPMDPSEVTMYKCSLCEFQTKLKNNLKRHNMLKHKDPSNVTLYKCTLCPLQTKLMGSLKRHMLIHKDPSEVTMYKCDLCLFETKHKINLKSHLLKHKDPTKVTLYKCDFCSYQTKYKVSLNKHMLKHKDPSEVTTYASTSNQT